MLHMAFSYKAKNIAYNSILSSVQTYSILLSTICCADGPPFSPERETCCILPFYRAFVFLTCNAETGISSCNLPFSSTASLWTNINKPIKLLLSWKKGASFCKLSFSATFLFCPFYRKTFLIHSLTSCLYSHTFLFPVSYAKTPEAHFFFMRFRHFLR